MRRQIIAACLGLFITACGSGGSSSGGGGSGGGGSGNRPSNGYITGINYDPAHSQTYIDGQKSGNVDQMRSSIDADLQQISALGFTVVKTYYSEYCSGNGCINVADEVAKYAKLKLALGVYEYFGGSNDRIFTQSQVNAAIKAVNDHPSEIVAIIVGNEDVSLIDHNGNNGAENIMTDIAKIKAGIMGTVPPIGTAQTQNTWMNHSTLPNGFLSSLTYVGANIYPYFGGVVSGIAAADDVPGNVSEIVTTLKNAGYSGPVAVTEEGFASSGTSSTLTVYPSQQSEIGYYNTWKNRVDTFDSYYYSMYDSIPGVEFPVDSSNNYFGLCTANGSTKDPAMINCGS